MAFGEASAQPTVTQVSPPFLAEFPGVQGGRGWLSFRQQSPLSPQLEECPAPPPAPTPIHICYPDPCVHCRGPRPNTGSALSLQNSPDPLWGGRAPLPLRNSPPTTSMSRHTHTRPHTCTHTHTQSPNSPALGLSSEPSPVPGAQGHLAAESECPASPRLFLCIRAR